MKIQILFICRKNFRSISNENVDLFCMQKNFRFVFNENTDLFFFMQKNYRTAFNENIDLIFRGMAHLQFGSLSFSLVLKPMSDMWQRHNPRVTKRARQIQLLSFLGSLTLFLSFPNKPHTSSLPIFFFSITTTI